MLHYLPKTSTVTHGLRLGLGSWLIPSYCNMNMGNRTFK